MNWFTLLDKRDNAVKVPYINSKLQKTLTLALLLKIYFRLKSAFIKTL